MEPTIDHMKPEDWEHVRSIYLQGIATGNATFEADAPPGAPHSWAMIRKP